jgi:SAM-dependent methyltransferase
MQQTLLFLRLLHAHKFLLEDKTPMTLQPWYKEAFRGLYLELYQHRDHSEAAQVVELVFQQTGLNPGSLVIDVPCGAGRHVQAFSHKGFRVVGIDLSPELLVSGRVDLGRSSHRPVILARADLRYPPLRPQCADLVANLFTSLGYFDREEENEKALLGLARLVRKGGWFLLDFLQAPWVMKSLQAKTERTTPTGLFVRETRVIEPPQAKFQIYPRIVKTIEIYDGLGGQPLAQYEERVALLERRFFEDTLAKAGLQITQSFGSYDGTRSSEDPEASRLILLAQRVE